MSRARAAVLALALVVPGHVLDLVHRTAEGHAPGPRPFVEMALLAGMVGVLLRHAPLRETLRGLPRGQQLTCVALVVILLFFQGLGRSHLTFPFMRWKMYSEVHEADPVFYDFEALRASGVREPLFPERTIGALGAGRLNARLRRVIELLAHEERAALARQDAADLPPAMRESLATSVRQRSRYAAALYLALEGIARLENRERPQDPIVSVAVWRNEVPLDAYTGRGSLRRSRIHRVPVDPEG